MKDEHPINLYKNIKEFNYLNTHQVVIGYFGEGKKGKKLLTIVRVNEYGAVIKAKGKFGWLTIPSVNALDGGIPLTPSEYAEKHSDSAHRLFKPKGKHVLAIADKHSENGIKIIYYLVRKVTIPARPFMRWTFVNNEKNYERMMKNGIDRVANGEMTGKQLYDLIGRRAQTDIRKTIARFKTPANAPATVALKPKHANDPLRGRNRAFTQMLTYKIEKQ